MPLGRESVIALGLCALAAALIPFSRDPLTNVFMPLVIGLAAICASRLQQRAQHERLRFEAEHDQLTRILRRAAFRTRGQAALAGGGMSALVVADIDGFRRINDEFGQHAGDELLRQIAKRLSGRMESGELLGRLGGDSFGLLLCGVHDRADIERRVGRIASALAYPFELALEHGPMVALTASFGIASSPDDGDGFEELLARADAARFQAKDGGRARTAFFDPGAIEALDAERRLREEIARGLESNEFVLHYQPHVELATGRTTGAEALIRWQHPERGLVGPADFIPFAERHGLAPALGAWVMRETIASAARLRLRDPDFRVWFNLSVTELHLDILQPRVDELAGPVTGVGIEITETSAMKDVAETARALALLRGAGFTIGLDDFGTGYSSLAHLRRLEIDVVKIDRSFVAGLPDDAQDVAIVEAVLSIAERFGFSTVAEGVETLGQAEMLAAAGCSHAQGYYYARPMPLESLEQRMATEGAPEEFRRAG